MPSPGEACGSPAAAPLALLAALEVEGWGRVNAGGAAHLVPALDLTKPFLRSCSPVGGGSPEVLVLSRKGGFLWVPASFGGRVLRPRFPENGLLPHSGPSGRIDRWCRVNR